MVVLSDEKQLIKTLIIDDDKFVIATLLKIIKASDLVIEAKVAYNGEQAMLMLDKEQADIIIIDAHLPDIEGAELLKKIKNNYNNLSTKVIAISGVEFALEDMMEVGADICLVKPFKMKKLISSIESLIYNIKRV